MAKEMTEARYNLLVKQKTYQLQRSGIIRKKHNNEINEIANGQLTKEQAEEYIKTVGERSYVEALEKRINQGKLKPLEQDQSLPSSKASQK